MLGSEIYDEKIHSYIVKDCEMAVRTNEAIGYYEAYHSLINRYLYPYTIPTGNGGAAKANKTTKNPPPPT